MKFGRWHHDPAGDRQRVEARRARFHLRASIFVNLVTLPILILMLRDIYFGHASQHWRRTTGEVTYANMRSTHCNLETADWIHAFMCSYVVEYRYLVEGVAHSGTRVSYPGTPPWHEIEPRFLPTAKVPVFADPGNPARAVLLPGLEFRGGVLLRLVPEGLAGVGGMLYLILAGLIWSRRRGSP